MARVRPNSAPEAPEPPRRRPEVVSDLTPPAQAPSPARERMQRIEAAFAEGATAVEPRYPGYLRLGLLLSGSIGLWGCLIAGGLLALRR